MALLCDTRLATVPAALGAVMFALGAPAPAAAGAEGEIAFIRSPACYGYNPACYASGGSLHAIRADGSGEREVVPRKGWNFTTLSWSPDGHSLAFGRADSQLWRLEPGLFALNPDGSGLRTVVPNTQINGADWSPDGSRIAFSTWEGMEVVGADGTGRRAIDATRAREPEWSPDCSEIAYIAGPPNDSEIRAMATAPSGGGRVIRRGYAGAIEWAPDGRRLAFVDHGGRDDRPSIHVIDADGSHERPITYGNGPSWSPDGRRLVFSDPLGNLRTVEVDAADPAHTERLVTVTAATGFWDGAPTWRPPLGGTAEPGVCDELAPPATNRRETERRRTRLRAGRACSPRRQGYYRQRGFVCRKARDGRHRLVRWRQGAELRDRNR